MKKQLHPSAQRLYEAAGKLSPPLTSQAEIARKLNESEQRVNNWESRPTGISAQGCISIQKKLGINASWLQDGEGEMFVFGTGPLGNLPLRAVLDAANCSSSARAAIDAIQQADRNGVSADAFNVLREMLRLLVTGTATGKALPVTRHPGDQVTGAGRFIGD